MLSVQEATNIINQNLPGGQIQWVIDYKDKNIYLFQVFRDEPFEEEWDPFFSVNKETGEFSDFSIITDGDISVISSLVESFKSS